VGHVGLRTRRGAGRPGALLLIAFILCVASATVAAVAIAASGHRSANAAHAVHSCHHLEHHRCQRHPSGKQLHHKHHKHHKQGTPKRSLPKNPGMTSPLTGPPAPVITGAGSAGSGSDGSGTSPGAGGNAPPATETPTAPAGPVHVQVTAEDSNGYHFILSRTSVPAGPVVIEFVNHGQDEHNIHAVEPTGGSEAGGLQENVKPGAHTDLSLNLHAGSYTLFCSLPGHEALGMKATLRVE
jgi:plastocyanin